MHQIRFICMHPFLHHFHRKKAILQAQLQQWVTIPDEVVPPANRRGTQMNALFYTGKGFGYLIPYWRGRLSLLPYLVRWDFPLEFDKTGF